MFWQVTMRKILLRIKLVVGKWFSIEIDYSSGEQNDKKLIEGSVVNRQEAAK